MFTNTNERRKKHCTIYFREEKVYEKNSLYLIRSNMMHQVLEWISQKKTKNKFGQTQKLQKKFVIDKENGLFMGLPFFFFDFFIFFFSNENNKNN